MEESGPSASVPGAAVALTPRQPAQPINDISAEQARSKPTGIGEFDRVLGGGIVPGAVILLTGEESASQVRGRAERIGALHPQLFLADETSLSTALGQIDATNPSLVIIDSVQTLQSDQLDGSAGSVAQVRAVATALIRVAKERSIPILLVGHVTKDGGIAGPRLLEHLVDVVCQFEGDRHTLWTHR